DGVREVQLDGGPDVAGVFRRDGGRRRAIGVHRGAATGALAGLFALDDVPMLGRLFKGTAENRVLDLETAHPPNAFWMPSSFSITSGWISSGVIRPAIS